MPKKLITFLFALSIILSVGTAYASGGISFITGGDAAGNDFVANNIENGVSVSGQGVTVTIVNGLVTVTKNNNVVKIGDSVEISGDMEAQKIESPINQVGGTGIAASGGISFTPTAVQNSVSNIQPAAVKDTSFTGKFFRKIGIE